MDEYTVYARTDSGGIITGVDSDAFLSNPTGWTEIDHGTGDKYHHAQANYLEQGLTDEYGLYNYKLVDGKPAFRTDEDKAPELTRIAAQMEISLLKSKLADTDYIAAKIAEGAATPEDYADKLADRALWRAKINELEDINHE